MKCWCLGWTPSFLNCFLEDPVLIRQQLEQLRQTVNSHSAAVGELAFQCVLRSCTKQFSTQAEATEHSTQPHPTKRASSEMGPISDRLIKVPRAHHASVSAAADGISVIAVEESRADSEAGHAQHAAEHAALQPLKRDSMQEFTSLELAVGADRVEVRVHKGLSRAKEPLQFGLFATGAHSKGDRVTGYGGVIRYGDDVYKDMPAVRTHARRVADSGGMVLDGHPLVSMLARPIPTCPKDLEECFFRGMQPLLPTALHYSAAALELFNRSALGYMVNTDEKSRWNVTIKHETIKIGDIPYRVPVLFASKPINKGDEIICDYNNNESRYIRLVQAQSASDSEVIAANSFSSASVALAGNLADCDKLASSEEDSKEAVETNQGSELETAVTSFLRQRISSMSRADLVTATRSSLREALQAVVGKANVEANKELIKRVIKQATDERMGDELVAMEQDSEASEEIKDAADSASMLDVENQLPASSEISQLKDDDADQTMCSNPSVAAPVGKTSDVAFAAASAGTAGQQLLPHASAPVAFAAASNQQTALNAGVRPAATEGKASAAAALPVTAPSEMKIVQDSTEDYLASQWDILGPRMMQQGFLFIRNALPVKNVELAHSVVQSFLRKKKIGKEKSAGTKDNTGTWITWDVSAEQGNGGSPTPEQERVRLTGSHRFMKQVYEKDVQQLCERLSGVLGSNPTRLPKATWFRSVGKQSDKGKPATVTHTDIGYHHRRTSLDLSPFFEKRHYVEDTAQKHKDGTDHKNDQIMCIGCTQSFCVQCDAGYASWKRDQLPSNRWRCAICINLPCRIWTIWTPLRDLTADDSRLEVHMGSHTGVLAQGYDSPHGHDNDELPSGYVIDEHKASVDWHSVPRNMKAGDIIIFNYKLVHRASEHKADSTRRSLDVRIAAHAFAQ